MKRSIILSGVILTALIIFSCATDRIRISRNVDLACKTPNSRYDYGRKRTIQAIKSYNKRNTRSGKLLARNYALKVSSSKRNYRKDRHPDKSDYNLPQTGNVNELTGSAINEQIFYQQLMSTLDNNLVKYKLKEIPVAVRANSEREDIDASLWNGNLQLTHNSVTRKSVYGHPVSEQMNNLILKESYNKSGAIVRNTGKPEPQDKTPFQKRESFVFMLALLAGLIPLAAIKANHKLSADISFWAAMNPWKTRLMFAVIETGLITSGFILGDKLADNGIHFSQFSRNLLLGAFLTSSLLYPVRHTSVKLIKYSYLKQKAFDLALAVSGFMLMVNAGNDPLLRTSFANKVSFKGHEQQNVLYADQEVQKQLLVYHSAKQLQDEQKVTGEEKKERKRKTVNTILVSILAVALGLLLAAAACGLACNEMVGLAYLVGIGGGGLLIGLTILAIRRIWHPRPKNRLKPSEGTHSVLPEGTLQV